MVEPPRHNDWLDLTKILTFFTNFIQKITLKLHYIVYPPKIMPQKNAESVYLVIQQVKPQFFLQMRGFLWEGLFVVLRSKNMICTAFKSCKLLNFCPSCNILGVK